MKQLTKTEYEQTVWWKDTQKWINSIRSELDSKRDAKPLKQWRVFEAKTWTLARATAWDEACSAENNEGAWDRECGEACAATWDAVILTPRETACSAAQCFAWDAAHNASKNAGQDTIGDAASDAALLARVKICDGLKLNVKHVKHAEERWEANKRGFRVLCDVNGVLYVYRKKVSR